MEKIEGLTLEELERRNEALRLEILAKRLHAAKLESQLLSRCKDKEEMKRRIEMNKLESGLI